MKLYIVIFLSGIVIGALGYALFTTNNQQPTTNNVKTVTTETTRTEGIPDTTVKFKSQNSKVKIKSTGTTEFNLDKNQAGIKKITIEQLNNGTIEQSNNDSSEVSVEFQYPETTIKQTDEVSSKTTVKDSTSFVKEIGEQDKWQIAIGSMQNFENEVEVNKYFEISYQKKIWFFYLKGFTGIHNKLNDALSNLKIHTKLELNIPLN